MFQLSSHETTGASVEHCSGTGNADWQSNGLFGFECRLLVLAEGERCGAGELLEALHEDIGHSGAEAELSGLSLQAKALK